MLSTPLARAPQVAAQQPATQTEESTTGLLDKEVYKELIQNGGLTSDNELFLSQIAQLEGQGSDPYLNKDNRKQMYQILAGITKLKNNKADFNTAVTNAKSTGGLNDTAVGSYGEVYTMKNGSIKALSVKDYMANSDSYGPLMTVADIMNQRQSNVNLANWNEAFNIANNSIGTSEIQKQLMDIVLKAGTISQSSTRTYSKDELKEQYVKRIASLTGKEPTAQQSQELSQLAEYINNPGDFLEITQSSESNQKPFKHAMTYLFNTLNEPAKNKLKVKAALGGMDSADAMISLLTEFHYKSDTSSSIKPVTAASVTGKSEKEAKEDMMPLTQFTSLFQAPLPKNTYEDYSFNDTKTGTMFKSNVLSVSPLIDKNDNVIPTTTLSSLMTNYQYNNMVDSGNIYMGDKKITQQDLRNIVINNKQDAAQVVIPVKEDGKTPDFESLQRFEQVYAIYKSKEKDISLNDAKQLFERQGFKVNIKEEIVDGGAKRKVIANSQHVKPFLLMSAYTTSKVDDVVDDNRYLMKMSSKEVDSVKPELEQAWTIGQGKDAKVDAPTGMFTNYYKGMILAPLKTEAAVAAGNLAKLGPKTVRPNLQDVQTNIKSGVSKTGGFNSNFGSDLLNN